MTGTDELRLHALRWAFQFHYHRDMMNAATHMAPVRFSPLTQTLCLEIQEIMKDKWEEGNEIPGFMAVYHTILWPQAFDTPVPDDG